MFFCAKFRGLTSENCCGEAAGENTEGEGDGFFGKNFQVERES